MLDFGEPVLTAHLLIWARFGVGLRARGYSQTGCLRLATLCPHPDRNPARAPMGAIGNVAGTVKTVRCVDVKDPPGTHTCRARGPGHDEDS